MARRRKKRRPRPSKGVQSRKSVHIRAHTRSPRGSNAGKPAVRVKAHVRKKPRSD